VLYEKGVGKEWSRVSAVADSTRTVYFGPYTSTIILYILICCVIIVILN